MSGIAGNGDSRKQKHCEVERRRRVKTNYYIKELASLLTAFNHDSQSRLDKFTILRLAIQRVKLLRSSLCSFSSFHLRPLFLSSGSLLKNLIAKMASKVAQDNLFMVVTCDLGKVLFVSKSSKDILNQDQGELVGQSLFDILHEDDVAKVKDQISYFNLMPKEMLVDSKTLQPVKSNQHESFIKLQNRSASDTLQPGSRRSFFCRMRSGRTRPPGDPHSSNSQCSASTSVSASSSASSPSPSSCERYIVMHCSGYLKAIKLRNDEYDDDDFDEETGAGLSNDRDSNENADRDVDARKKEDSNFRTVNCLVAVCRRSDLDRYLKPDRPLTFTCRYSKEGKFTFVDQRTTLALGYTPQELMGTSHYAYCHKDSVNTFKECHRQCILKPGTVSTDIYQFRRADGQYMWLQTSLKSFRNPWTKIIDYIVANHTTAEESDPRYNEGCVPTKFNQDMTREANSQSSLVPSKECKESASPGSPSMGSLYSIDSCASGSNIQVLLNQINRVRPGGMRNPLECLERRSDACHNHNNNNQHHHHRAHNHQGSDATGSSYGSSTRKTKRVRFSDTQSCSFVSSQNSSSLSSSGRFAPTVNKFINRASDVSPLVTQTSETYSETTTADSLVEQQPQPTAQQTRPAAQLVAKNKNDSKEVASYQFASQNQAQTLVNAGFSVGPVQVCPDNRGQQQNFEMQQTVCQQVACPPAPALPNHSICATQPNFPPSATVNLAPSNVNPNNVRHEPHYIDADSCRTGMGGPRLVTAIVNRAPSINLTCDNQILQSIQSQPNDGFNAHMAYQDTFTQQQVDPTYMNTAVAAVDATYTTVDVAIGHPMVTAGMSRPPLINSTSAIEPLQRPYQNLYRAQIESVQMPDETVAGATEVSWSNQPGAYVTPSVIGTGPDQIVENQVAGGEEQATRQRQYEYVMQQQQLCDHHQQQQQQMAAVNVNQIPQSIEIQPNDGFNTHMTYQDTFTQQQVDPTYMNTAVAAVDATYTTVDAAIGQPMGQVQDNSITPMSMGGQEQQQASQQGQSTDVGIQMMLNLSGGTYHNMTTDTMQSDGQPQMDSCHQVPASSVEGPSNMVGMDVAINQSDQMGIGHHSHCQQSAGHKCCATGMTSNTDGDLNSTHLSPLAVNDLDEILECLAACDPDSQVYNMQNSV